MTANLIGRLSTGGSRRLVSVAVAVVALSCVVTACTAAPAAGTAAVTSSSSATFAKRVTIGGGRSMYIECQGTGSPTVLLLSGSGLASDVWNFPEQATPTVYPNVGTFTRVCAYDRPGVQYLDGKPSQSDPVPQPTTTQNSVADLTALLKAADVPGPYVLVVHSLSGLIARLFAAQHADAVKGIVFVDVLTPELRANMTTDEWEAWKEANARQPEAIAAYLPLERQNFDVILDEVKAAAPLKPMPVVVLTADKKYGDLVPLYLDQGLLPPSVARDFGTVIDRANTAAQNELAALVPGEKHITNTKSGHNMMIDNGPLVISSTREVVDAVRAGKGSLNG